MTADLTQDSTAGARQAAFEALAAEAAACRRCEAMCGRSAVLSGRNGRVGARLMFVGEAPGRQGGDRTRVPFSGDQSGAHRRPTRRELANCSDFLRRQIEVVSPSVVVTLGAVSLEALRAVEYHQFSLKENVGQILEWRGRLLVPLYHPSPQVLASHRREAAQLEDYKSVARALRLASLRGLGARRRAVKR